MFEWISVIGILIICAGLSIRHILKKINKSGKGCCCSQASKASCCENNTSTHCCNNPNND